MITEELHELKEIVSDLENRVKALEDCECGNVKPKCENILLLSIPTLSECLRLCKADDEERAKVYRDIAQRLRNSEK